MTHATDLARTHYRADGLLDRIKTALDRIAPHDAPLSVAQLAPLDQFHTRGILATTELAEEAALTAASRVLDLGSGIGGPARYIAATYGCQVTGVDLSSSFVETAQYLTARCGLAERAVFEEGNILSLLFPAASFDAAFLQHVAMNIQDRASLYAEVHRILKPGGRFVTYDLVQRSGEAIYPAPWARDASASHLLTEDETRTALETAGFKVQLWRDDTPAAVEWFQTALAAPPQNGPNLGVVMGPEFSTATANLARNLRENRLGVLSAVLIAT